MPPKNAAAAPAAPAAPTPAGGSPPISDYVREAVREKASRDWQQLRQKSEAFEALTRLIDTLTAAEREIAPSAALVLAAAPEAGLGSRIKKLRRAVDEATGLSRDIVHALGGTTSREALDKARSAILEALHSAGLDETALEAKASAAETAPEPPSAAAAESDEPPATDEAAPSKD